MSIIHLIASDNFIVLNKTLIKQLGLEAAVILGELASEAAYWQNRDEMSQDGFFYSTVANMEDNTSLTAHQQRQALELLVDRGLIQIERRGMPCKRFIKINEDAVVKNFNNKMLKNLTTSCEKFEEQVVKNFNGNNNKNKNNNKNNKNNVSGFDAILDSVDVIRDNPTLREAFIEFIKMRKLLKKPLTDRALKLSINEAFKLSNGDPATMQAIVEQSIRRSWAGMFPLKEADYNPYKKRRTGEDVGIKYVGNQAKQEEAGGENQEDIFDLFGED